jgi:sugar lactone lactonase YvrE
MAIVGDTLIVADIDAVRMFNARTGAAVGSVSFAANKANFLNDVTVGGDGAIYITDTGIRFSPTGEMSHPGPDRIFKIVGRTGSEAVADSALGGPNGIAWDKANNRFIVGSSASKALLAWTPGSAPTPLASGPGEYDGVEVLGDGRVLASSWADSSVYVVSGGTMTKLVTGVNSPADIGANGKGVVAVPLLMDNRVEFWNIGGSR